METTEPLMEVSEYLLLLQQFWWPFCRILAIMSMAPLLNHKALSIRARVLLALALTFALGAALPAPPAVDIFSVQSLLLTLEQILFGILLGVTLQLAFTIFMLVGEVVSTQMGMSMARYNDPLNGVSSSSILYQLYFILLVFLFFAIDGHLLTVGIVYQSFIYWPVGSGLHYFSFEALIQAIAWVFSAAVLVTLPLVFCMTVVQFCFGLLNRISPAMNLFSLGFPITILVGLVCIYLTIPNLSDSYLHLTRELTATISTILQGG